jgi:hypothetical protein
LLENEARHFGETKAKLVKLYRKDLQSGKHHLSMSENAGMMHLQGPLPQVDVGGAADEMSLRCPEAKEIN